MLRMRTLPAGFIEPCLPTKADTLPSGGLWIHEIKHDGFRIVARKNGAQVRLYSRPGNDLTDRFPLIVETLANVRTVPAALGQGFKSHHAADRKSLCDPAYTLSPRLRRSAHDSNRRPSADRPRQIAYRVECA
jgi:ATP dependent DNA ligase domain